MGVQVDVTAGGVVGGPMPVWNKTMSAEDMLHKQGALTANQINSALQGMAVQVGAARGVHAGCVRMCVRAWTLAAAGGCLLRQKRSCSHSRGHVSLTPCHAILCVPPP